MRHALTGTLLLLAALTPVWAEPTPPDIHRLIEQLGDEKFEVRQAAEEAIEAFGPDALPALRKALAAKPPLDMTQRIEQFIPRFQLAFVTTPKRVTLHAEGRPLQEVVAALAQQSGYPLTLAPDGVKADKAYDFAFDKTPFWEALDQVCASAELGTTYDPATKRFNLRASDQYQPFVSRQGAFRVVAQGFQYSLARNRNNQFALAPRKGEINATRVDRENLFFSFVVEAEPGVTVHGLGPVVIEEATDDQKQSVAPDLLAAANRFARGRVLGNGMFVPAMQHAASTPLAIPSKDAKTLRVVKGTVTAQVEIEKKALVLVDKFEDAAGKQVEAGDLQVEIAQFKDGGNGTYTVQLMLKAKGAVAGIQQLQTLEVELQDEDGKAYQIVGQGLTPKLGGFQRQLTFGPPTGGDKVKPAAKLVYIQRVTRDYTVPFEFHDLPLP